MARHLPRGRERSAHGEPGWTFAGSHFSRHRYRGLMHRGRRGLGFLVVTAALATAWTAGCASEDSSARPAASGAPATTGAPTSSAAPVTTGSRGPGASGQPITFAFAG